MNCLENRVIVDELLDELLDLAERARVLAHRIRAPDPMENSGWSGISHSASRSFARARGSFGPFG